MKRSIDVLGLGVLGACVALCSVAGVAAQQAPTEPEEAAAPAPESTDQAAPPTPTPPTPTPTPTPAPPPEAKPEVVVTERIYASAAISRSDSRSAANDWMIAPADTVRVGFESALITADGDLTPILGTPLLALTDLVLVRLSAGYSVAGKVELFGGLSLLPKQPIPTEALAFQGAGVGARVGLASSWALMLSGQAGPTIDGDDPFVDGALTLDGRYRADRYLVFEGNVGVGGTALSPAGDLVGLMEALAAGDVILQQPRKAAVSAGIQFAFPFWSEDSARAPLDPQTRVDVHVTGVLAFADEWDVWLRGSVIDRGELSAPGSVLPILDGGFDQRQLTLGLTYRSEQREPDFGL